jgi:hypothetical protein
MNGIPGMRQLHVITKTVLSIALALAAGEVTRGETLQRLPNVESRVIQLESDVAGLRALLDQASSKRDSDFLECETYCDTQGWIAGYEATFFKYYAARGVSGFLGTDIRFDYEPAPRVWIGYVGPTGVGIRARYWEYEEADFSLTAGGRQVDTLRIDTHVFDLELTNWIEIGRYWSALVTAGGRYVDYEETRQTTGTIVVGQTSQFTSDNSGGTLGAELHAHVTSNGTLFASGRSSVVFGDYVERAGATLFTVREDLDTLHFMWDSQLGAEWRWERPRTDIFIRVAAEVQYWTDFVDETSIGFAGFTTACGFVF